MPIRWRLTLLFGFVLSSILVLSGVATHALLQNYLRSGVDDDLRFQSARVHETLDVGEASEPLDYSIIHSRLPTINEFAFPGVYIQLIDENGVAVVRSANMGDQALPVDPVAAERALRGIVTTKTLAAGDGARIRVMVSPLHFQEQTLLLEVGQSMKQLDELMVRFRWALAAGIWASLVLSVVLADVVVRKALAPVQHLTKTARSIGESSDFERRVGYEGPPDEVGRLANTIDYMLQRMETAFRSQRDFLADASHELRTPLTVMKGSLDLLRRNLNEEDRRESLAAVRKEVDRMTRVVDDLLLLAEVEAGAVGKQESVRLGEVLLDGFTRAKQQARNLKIALGRHEDLVVKGDAYRMKQMLGNLVDNAIKYTPEGGAITLSCYRNGEWAVLEVADTGMGIDGEHLPHVFERFYRADKARSRGEGGTGLGLAIVKEIAESMGGLVEVRSEPGVGSRFIVRIRI